FQIGLNFYNLPLALSAKAVGTVLLPHLSRDALRSEWAKFRETYERGLAWSWFIAVPASIALVVLARPIGHALAFGAMEHDDGPALLSASIAVLGCALVAACVNEFARQACYARHDIRTPLVAGVVLVAITLLGAPVAVTTFGGAGALAALGLVVVAGELVRSMIVDRAARTGTPRHPGWARRTLARDAAAAIA